jgi:hypothetical protein
MTVQTKIEAAAPVAPKPYSFKGANKAVRDAALAGIASCAYVEGRARADMIEQLRLALGKKPTDADINAIRTEYIVGRTAQRLTPSDLPKVDATIADRITFARALLNSYAMPVKDGVKARPLRKGQLGRRTVAQQTVIRNAEAAWSLVKAELGFGAAQTQATKNAKQTRKPRMAGASSAGTGITHSQLVRSTDGGPITAKDACGYIDSMAATMLAFSNKHAAVLPTLYGLSVKRFHAAIADAAKQVKLA